MLLELRSGVFIANIEHMHHDSRDINIMFFCLIFNIYLLAVNDSTIHLNPSQQSLFKVNNRNTRTMCEICPKLTVNTPERRQWRSSCVFIVNFEHISRLGLVFLLLILGR